MEMKLISALHHQSQVTVEHLIGRRWIGRAFRKKFSVFKQRLKIAVQKPLVLHAVIVCIHFIAFLRRID
uniref:Ell-associated factor Eaf n=1 Tax=Parascaris univalens TaxID=6257 RepID=A0A915C3B5_PARUN